MSDTYKNWTTSKTPGGDLNTARSALRSSRVDRLVPDDGRSKIYTKRT